MDWTGGVRRRFAPGKNNAVIQKQKAHFAKARSTFQHPSSSKSSFRPAFHGRSTKHTSHWLGHANGGNSSQDGHHPSQTLQSRHSQSRHVEAIRAKTAGDKQDHAIHITSSSISSSQSPSPAKNNTEPSIAERSPSLEPHQDAVSEEQKLLVTNRRRLLARSDWLGLSAKRPVHIKFRNSRDNDRIGKRRKVANSTSHKGRRAVKRLVTPLFEENLLRQEHLMSGALPRGDKIQVNIGTDALASQTQPTRHSQTPRVTTGRHPSTDFGPLSEEPMLLGDDGDSFDVRSPERPHTYENPDQARESSLDAHQYAVAEALESMCVEHTVFGSPHLQRAPETAQMVHDHQTDNEFDRLLPYRAVPLSVGHGGNGTSYLTQNKVDGYSRLPLIEPHDENSTYHATNAPTAKSNTMEMVSKDVNDEDSWRGSMHIEEPTPSKSSVAALKSSSLHMTASDSSHRPVLPAGLDYSLAYEGQLSTPTGIGTQGSLLHSPTAPAHMLASTANLASPSASYKQILHLVGQHPGLPASRHNEADEEDAAWRDFIIGSQDSSELSLRGATTRGGYLGTAEHSEQPHDENVSMLDVSGLGTSVNSTTGYTQRTNHPDPYSIPQATRDRRHNRRRSHSRRGTIHPKPLIEVVAADLEIEDDDIEDARPESARRTRSVMPSQSSILNPRRFNLKKRTETVSSSTPDAMPLRRAPKRAKTRADFKARDVYDLVDSEGASLS